MKILIYKLNKSKIPLLYDLGGIIKIWRPGLLSVKHQRLPNKYFVWWFFHYLGIFKNKNLQIWLYYVSNKLAHFFCVVPKHYRWPFMKPEDLQLTYVITEKEFQGRGMAFKVISKAINQIPLKGDLWYVTDESNVPSQKLASKLGFELVGYGKHKRVFNGVIKILNIEKLDNEKD